MNDATPDDPRQTAASRDMPRSTMVNHGQSRLTATDRDLSQYTMTIEEAVALFKNAGLERNKRTVERYCEHSQIDAVKLVAAYGPTWFLNPESVEGKIKKLQQFEDIKKQRANTETPSDSEARHPNSDHDMSRSVAVDRDIPRQDETPTEPVSHPVVSVRDVALEEENRRLKQENLDLRIDNRGLVQTVNTLVEETREFAKERREMIGERKTFMAQIGELTTRMLQLTGRREDRPPTHVQADVIPSRVIDVDVRPNGRDGGVDNSGAGNLGESVQ
jgi:hypothetical protein